MKKYKEAFIPIRMILVVILFLIWMLYVKDLNWSPPDVISDNHIVGTYVKNPESSSRRKFVNLGVGVSKKFVKVNSISDYEKELMLFNLPVLSIFSKSNATLVSKVNVRGLYNNNYYVINVRYIHNVDGSINSVVELSHLNSKTLETLGLEYEKSITLPYYINNLKKDSKVSVNGDIITPSKVLKEKVLSYKVPRNTFFKFNYTTQSKVFIVTLFLYYTLSLSALLYFISKHVEYINSVKGEFHEK